MVKKKLAVCGCSFMTSSYVIWNRMRGADWPDYPVVNDIKKTNLPEFFIDELKSRAYEHNVSFLDRYAKEKNFDYINLAQGGASNFFIRLQINQAIDRKADYIIIGASAPDRFEIPAPSIDISEDTREFNSKKYIVSTQLTHNLNFMPAELISAIKYYTTYIQDNDIDITKSYFLLRDGLNQLEKKKIPYVFIPGPLKDQDWSENYIVWPKDEYQPWDTQHGIYASGNHNNAQSHDDYFTTLLNITHDWKNGI
jgi:hypothetical protein